MVASISNDFFTIVPFSFIDGFRIHDKVYLQKDGLTVKCGYGLLGRVVNALGDPIDAKGKIIGVAIAPGLKTAIRSLSQNTAKLFDVPLELPDSVLGKNTVHAIQAGILIGYEGLVTTMLRKIKAELNDPNCAAIATGGLSSIITTIKDQFTEGGKHLTLDGLRLTGELQL